MSHGLSYQMFQKVGRWPGPCLEMQMAPQMVDGAMLQWMVLQMAHPSEQLAAQTTAHGLARQAAQKMSWWAEPSSEMRVAQRSVPRMAQQMAHRVE